MAADEADFSYISFLVDDYLQQNLPLNAGHARIFWILWVNSLFEQACHDTRRYAHTLHRSHRGDCRKRSIGIGF